MVGCWCGGLETSRSYITRPFPTATWVRIPLWPHIAYSPKAIFEYRIIYYKNHLNSSKKVLPEIEALSLDLPEILDIKGIGILDRSGLFVSLRKE